MAIKNNFILIIISVVGLTAIPVFADPLPSADQLQTMIQQLSQQVQTLQNQIVNLNIQLANSKIAKIKFDKTLSRGTSGTDVKQIQEYLRLFPKIYPEGLVTGIYGTLTENAVKKFQKTYSLPESGIVGPQTRKQLKENIAKEIKARFTISHVAPLTTPLPSQLNNTLSTSTASTSSSSTSLDLGNSDLIFPDEYDNNASSSTDDTFLSPESDFYAFSGLAETTLPTTTDNTSTTTISIITQSTSTANSASSSIANVSKFNISNILTTNITGSAAEIKWQTNVLSDSEVYYGITRSYSDSKTNKHLNVNHEIPLSDLKKNTTYHFHVQSKDAKGNIAVSDDQIFTTKN